MNREIKERIKKYALENQGEEVCGLVLVDKFGKVTVTKEENLAENKSKSFVMSPLAILKAKKNHHIAAYYHSHGENSEEKPERLSVRDLDVSEEVCIPALVYAPINDSWGYHVPNTYKPVPLLGREFAWGVWDCYTIVRDYFRERGVYLKSFFAPEMESDTKDYCVEKYITEGAREVKLENIETGDVIVFYWVNKIPCHAAVYLGENRYLHQPISRLSTIDYFDEKTAERIYKIFRYNG